ncbi:MAG: 50S ribosomal protein L21 [Bacteroidales bacterium]|nr:50S ribosomal protein L21 [Bacteroidales bacterium]
MYAIVEIAGQQFKVEKKQEIFVHRLEEKEGAKVEFSDVMLIDNNGTINIGTPTIDGAVVSAKVLEHLKGDKVLVFKKKRRKGYQKLNGHRQQFTRIQISDILENVPKAAAKKEEKEATIADEKPEAKKDVKKPASKKKATSAKEPKPAAKKEAKAAPKAKKPAAKAETKKAAPAKEASPKAAPKAKKADEEKKEDK